MRLKILAPLRIRDFALLWTGMTISLVGSGISIVAMAWQVLQVSNRPSALGYVGAARFAPQIVFLLLGGVLTDRFERRRMMLAADTIRGLAIGALGVLSVTGHIALWHIVALVAVFGFGDALFGPAFGALVPEIVPAEQLVQANSLDQFVRPAAQLLGPALGGFLVAAWGPGNAFLVDAATFGCSLAALLAISARPILRDTNIQRSVRRELREGFAFVRRQPWLWGTLGAAAFGNIAGGAVYVLLPYIVKNRLHDGAADLGLVFSVGAVGSILAALVLGQAGLPRRHIAFMLLTWGVAGLGAAVYAFVGSLWEAMAISLAANALVACGSVVWGTLMHTLVPRPLLGRVTSVDWLVSVCLLPLSYAVIGPVAESVGTRPTLIACGLIGFGANVLFLLLVPGVRDTERSGPMVAAREAA